MIAATRKWLRRYRTPFAIGFGIVATGYVATQYVLGKISDARERMSSDRIARENLRRRFEQNQEDCTFTVLALLPTATENILAELETERITFELQQQKAAKLALSGDIQPSEFSSAPPSVTDEDGRSMASLQSESGVHVGQLGIPPTSVPGDGNQIRTQQTSRARKTKLQLWNDLKISAITRAFTLIYTLALLTLLTRIQLNLLGRRSYLSSVVSLAAGGTEQSTISLENNDDDNSDQAYGNDFETNRKYLTFSWWLLHKGWRQIMLDLENAVKEVFGKLSPRDDVAMQQFSELALEVRMKVEGATVSDRQAKKWLQYLLPNRDEEDFVLRESGMTTGGSTPEEISTSHLDQTPLRRLLDETADLIDSPPFSHVLTKLLDAGFSTLVDQKIAQQSFKVPAAPETLDTEIPRITEVLAVKPVKLPIVLATLTRQAHSIGNGMPNEYLQSMEQVRDLEAFAAVVYSSNWETEIAPIVEEKSGAAKTEQFSSTTEARPERSSAISHKGTDTAEIVNLENAWEKAIQPGDEVTLC